MRMEKQRILENVCLVIIAFIFAWLFFSKNEKIITETKIEKTEKHDTIFKKDTLTLTTFKEKPIEIIKTDTFITTKKDTVILPTEKKEFERTVCSNVDTAKVKVYTTGINTTLDSVSVSFNRREITNTIYIKETNTKQKKKLISISPQIGAGYGFFNKKPDIYVGVGVSFNF